MPQERLQKFLSRMGVASRRAADEMIRTGRVSVDGQVVTELGVKVDPERAAVLVDGRRVRPVAPVTLMLHKPYGYVSTTRDPQGRRTVMDLVGEKYGRLYPVGRLDYDATGLLLLTNNGELAQRLTHPRYQAPRTYRVTVAGEVAKETLGRLAAGLELDGRPVAAGVIWRKREADKTVLELTVWEGRYHLIKRLMEQVGHPVLKLKRIALGPLRLGRLPRGSYRRLTGQELEDLQKAVGFK
ncbi:MAG: rRNA pseudouridine synthase [Deltaproteobacteria bacterium]|nr:rRNA pseudouridine synthase [Deltaproteobacteria bacterium]